MLKNCASCRKKMLIKIILNVLDVKPSDLVREIHLSSTQVSRYLSGERDSHDIDIYLIEQVFEIKVKEYVRTNPIKQSSNLA